MTPPDSGKGKLQDAERYLRRVLDLRGRDAWFELDEDGNVSMLERRARSPSEEGER